jgi:tetratricopeptide (TPR) repeat protein
VEAKSEDMIWTDEFKATTSEMPQLFETVSQVIATKLDPDMVENIRIHEEVNPEAYLEIVQGNIQLQKFTTDAIWKGLRHFEKTIQLDSTNLEGYLGVAKAWIYLQQLSVVNPREARPNIFKYMEIARGIDPDHWQFHLIDGIKKFYIDFDFEAGIESALKSIELNPNNSDCRSLLAHCYMIVGNWDAAWEQMRYAKEIDPLNPQVIGFEFLMFAQQGKMLSAVKSMRIQAAVDPENLFYKQFALAENMALGNDKEAIKWLKLLFGDVTQPILLSKYIDETFAETKSVEDT